MEPLPGIYSVSDLIRPLVSAGKAVIVLVQDGLDIEIPVIKAFPSCTVMSGVSMIGSRLKGNVVYHEDPDDVIIGPHLHSGLDHQTQLESAKLFVEIYSAGGAAKCTFRQHLVLSLEEVDV